MRKIIKLLASLSFYFYCSSSISAQDNFTGINDSVIDLTCVQSCAPLHFKVPHLKSDEAYSVMQVPYAPYAYTTPGGNELPADFYNDDVFSDVITLPFTACFYGGEYSEVVLSSNGLLTFDASNAGCNSATYFIDPPVPLDGGLQCELNSLYYPRASIMGVFSDLDASAAACPPDRKIEWRIEGVAPFRRFIASWYHVGAYNAAGNSNSCGLTRPTTFQMVVNEATGIIEVFIERKTCFDTGTGNAILGIQNWDRDKALTAPGKNATRWTAEKEGYWFIPSGGTSRFVRSELLTLGGVVLQTATTAGTTPGFMDINFQDVCPVNPSEQYIVRTIYASCSANPAEQVVINDTITINKNVLPVGAIPVNTDCGPGTGTIRAFIAMANSSTGPYTFELNPGGTLLAGIMDTARFNDLTAGDYTITASDATGCTNTIPVTIASTGKFAVAYAIDPPGCAGASNGTITINPPAGLGPLTYSIQGGPWSASNVFTGLQGPSLYSIRVSAGAGCDTMVVNVSMPAGTSTLVGTATGIPTSCAGAGDGSIVVTPAGSAYEYSIDGGTGWQTANTFDNLIPGAYHVLIRQGVSCVSQPIPVAVAAGSGLTVTAISTPTSCTGVNNGRISVTTNGRAPFTFTLDGITVQSNVPDRTITFGNLAAGVHSITVTDAAGCTTTAPVTATVATGTGYTVDYTTTGTSCAGLSNGSILVTPRAAAPASYQFVLSPGNSIQNGAAANFTGLAAGNYSVLVTDANGCEVSITNMNVSQGGGLLAGVTLSPVSCFGGSDGSITVSPTNGSGPYTFVLNGSSIQVGQTETVFENLASNVYTISITDAAGCIASPISHTLTQPVLLTVPAPQVQAVSCNAGNDGVITVHPTGGTPPYTYSLDNINFKSGNSFTVAQGVYVVYVKDANGCDARSENIAVTEPATLAATVVSTSNATCGGGNDAVIEVAAAGGTAPYSYSTNGTDFQSSNRLNVLPGAHDITVRDVNNCMVVITGVVAGLTDNLILAVSDPPAICEGTGVQLQATGNATSYTWTPADNSLTNPGTAMPVASPSVTTRYTVMATLGNCSRTADVTVTVLPAPEADAGLPPAICFGQNAQLQGSGGVSYNWSPATYLDNPNIANPLVIKAEQTVTYSLLVTDINNCTSVVADNVTVQVTPPIKIDVSPLDTIIHAGAAVQLRANSEGVSYAWSPVTGLNNPAVSDPVVSGLAEGDMIRYRVSTTTAAGCQGEAFVTVRVFKGPEIYVPTAFTPNNDGKNEVFIPIPVGILQVQYFRVFNRWGQLMFSTDRHNHGWDGRTGGEEQPAGVYVWVMQAVTETGKAITKKGTVTLIR